MPVYRYRCGQCRTTSPIVRTRVELYSERDRHRARVHDGHRPDGERLLQRRRPTVRPGVVVLVIAVALLLLILAH